MPDRFLSFYAAQKFASEQLLHQYSLAYGLATLSFRFFNVYGQGQDPASPYSGVLSRFLHFIQEQQPLVLQGGGSAVRDFVHVSDLARALASAVDVSEEKLLGQAVNLASGRSVSIREVAQEVEKIVRPQTPARWKGYAEVPARTGDVRVSHADVNRARELLGFEAQTSLAQGLAQLFTL